MHVGVPHALDGGVLGVVVLLLVLELPPGGVGQGVKPAAELVSALLVDALPVPLAVH